MIIVLISFFVLGSVIGSFIYAAVFRLQHNISIRKKEDRSKCPNCNHILGPLDLVPIFSYIFLKGKCRYCKQNISFEYPLFEIIMGIVFVLSGLALTQTIDFSNFTLLSYFDILKIILLYLYIFTSVTILMFFALSDYKYKIIPNVVIIPCIFILTYFYLILFFVLYFVGNGNYIDAFSHILSGIGAGLFFLAIIIITQGKGMGGGDFKMAIFLGLLLGFPGIVVSLYVSFFLGAVVGVILLINKRKTLKQSIPFGPYLSLGALTFLLYGDILIKAINARFWF